PNNNRWRTQIRVPPTILRAAKLSLFTIVIVMAALSIYLSVFGRGIWINQAQFLLIAQQWLLRREMYLELGDIHPPPMHMLNAAVIILSRLTGWPLVLCFNMFFTFLVVVSGVLFGLANPRLRFAAACSWITLLVFTANDFMFVDRDYLFM